MLMRSFFLYLSRSKAARRVIMVLPGVHRVIRRFVAGETLEQGLRAAKALNDKKIDVILDYLGESVSNAAESQQAAKAYIELLDGIARAGVRSSASLKLTQLGLDVGEDVCLANMRQILTRAAQHKLLVWIDMESSDYVDRTLKIFHTLLKEFGPKQVGAVIQAYLYRSEADVQGLIDAGAAVRLVKGAYKEPPSVAFPDKAEVDRNLVKLTEMFFKPESRAKGAYVGVASHDEAIISATKKLADQYGMGKQEFEFQMLYGIRQAAQQQLADEGYRSMVYVPYGAQWYPYFMRRLAERPANVWFLAKNFFKG